MSLGPDPLLPIEEYFQKQPSEQELLQSHKEFLACASWILETLLQGEAFPLMNSLVVGTSVPIGSRLLGTQWVVDPAQAAFQHALLMAWNGRYEQYYGPHAYLLTWAGLLPMADYLNRKRIVRGQEPITLGHVYRLMSQLRTLYEDLARVWSGPAFQRWIVQLLIGAGCLHLMRKPGAHILSLWEHITCAGLGLPYHGSDRKDSAWAIGTDCHQAIMMAYSVVQTSCQREFVSYPPVSPGPAFTLLNQEKIAFEQVRHELEQSITKAYTNPDLGICDLLLALDKPQDWDLPISEIFSSCSAL